MPKTDNKFVKGETQPFKSSRQQRHTYASRVGIAKRALRTFYWLYVRLIFF